MNLNEKDLEQLMADATLGEGARNFFALIEKAEADKEMTEKLAQLSKAPPNEIIEYGKTLGFSFSEADMAEAGEKLLGQKKELSEEELDNVAGGLATLAVLAVASVLGALAVAAIAVGYVVAAAVGASAEE